MKKKLQLLLLLLMINMTICFASVVSVAAATVTPAKPTITVVKKSTDTSVWIKWAQAKNAKKYELFCSVDGGAYKKIAVTMKLYYKHTGLKPGSIYSYKLRASNGTNKSKYSAVKKYKVPKKNVYKASTNSVYLTKTQNSKRITVTYSGASCTVQYKSSDTSVADCEWDKDWIGDTIGLTITGFKKGSCTITLTNTADSQKVQIYVDVDFPTTNEYIGFDVSDLELKVGETKTVNVITDNGYAINAARSNRCISMEWKEWISGTHTIPISITGISSGEAIMTVSDDRDSNVFAVLRIIVVGDKQEVAFDKVVATINNSQFMDSDGRRCLAAILKKPDDTYIYAIGYNTDEDALEFGYSSSITGLSSSFVTMTLKRSELNNSSIFAFVREKMIIGEFESNIYVEKATYTSYRTPTIVITKRPSSAYYTEASVKSALQNTLNSAIAGWNALLFDEADIHINDLGFLMY